MKGRKIAEKSKALMRALPRDLRKVPRYIEGDGLNDFMVVIRDHE